MPEEEQVVENQEQVAPEESVETQPTSEQGSVEESKEEELRNQLAFVQQRYQGLTEQLGVDAPEYLEAWRQQQRRGEPAEAEPEPVEPEPEETGDPYIDKINALERQLAQMPKVLNQTLEQREQTMRQAQIQHQFQRDVAQMDTKVQDYARDLKISPEVYNREMATLRQRNITPQTVGPRGFGVQLAERLALYATSQRNAAPETQAEVAAKARQAQLAAQPGGAPAPYGGKDPDAENDRRADEIYPDDPQFRE